MWEVSTSVTNPFIFFLSEQLPPCRGGVACEMFFAPRAIAFAFPCSTFISWTSFANSCDLLLSEIGTHGHLQGPGQPFHLFQRTSIWHLQLRLQSDCTSQLSTTGTWDALEWWEWVFFGKDWMYPWVYVVTDPFKNVRIYSRDRETWTTEKTR